MFAVEARLVPTSSISGLGDNPLTLQDATSKALAHFAIKSGKPVLYIPSVISNDELNIIVAHWRQYCERKEN